MGARRDSWNDEWAGRSISFIDATRVLRGEFAPHPATGDPERDQCLAAFWSAIAPLEDTDLRWLCDRLEGWVGGTCPRRSGGYVTFVTRDGEGDRGHLLGDIWDHLRSLPAAGLCELGALLSARQPACA